MRTLGSTSISISWHMSRASLLKKENHHFQFRLSWSATFLVAHLQKLMLKPHPCVWPHPMRASRAQYLLIALQSQTKTKLIIVAPCHVPAFYKGAQNRRSAKRAHMHIHVDLSLRPRPRSWGSKLRNLNTSHAHRKRAGLSGPSGPVKYSHLSEFQERPKLRLLSGRM